MQSGLDRGSWWGRRESMMSWCPWWGLVPLGARRSIQNTAHPASHISGQHCRPSKAKFCEANFGLIRLIGIFGGDMVVVVIWWWWWWGGCSCNHEIEATVQGRKEEGSLKDQSSQKSQGSIFLKFRFQVASLCVETMGGWWCQSWTAHCGIAHLQPKWHQRDSIHLSLPPPRNSFPLHQPLLRSESDNVVAVKLALTLGCKELWFICHSNLTRNSFHAVLHRRQQCISCRTSLGPPTVSVAALVWGDHVDHLLWGRNELV